MSSKTLRRHESVAQDVGDRTEASVQDIVAGELPTISAVDFKSTMRLLAAAVCVVTTRHGTLANGMTATAVCAVSADPASILVVVNRSNRSHALIRDSGVFAVHVLSKGQEAVAAHFAARPEEPFAGMPMGSGATAAPIMEDCSTVLECVLGLATDFGTHTIFIGRIVTARHAPMEPLIYCQGNFGSLA